VTASTLLLYISLALGLQIMLGLAYALLRRRVPASPLLSVSKTAAPIVQSGDWSGLRAFRVTRRVYEDAAQTQCSFYLEPLDGPPLAAFKPGQFLTFNLLPGFEADGVARTLTRCYSLSDSPQPQCYRVTIKRVAAPASPPGLPAGAASNYFHDQVHAGDTLQLRAPSGHFHLDMDSQTPVVLVAGGIGITPMVSMLRWCLQNQPQRAVHLYYGVRNSAEHAFKDTLEDMADRLPHIQLYMVYSKPLPEDREGADFQHQGHVDLALLQRTLPRGEQQFYLCGPSAMMESLVPALAQWGVAARDIHFEAFGPASVRLPTEASASAEVALPVAVNFRRSGRTLEWQGKHASLLDFAEAHGIQVESGCRSGSCGSCVSSIISGTVDYASAPDFNLAPGQCLLCVGKPRDALTLDA
jgi:ferredoxin-NADP reductase